MFPAIEKLLILQDRDRKIIRSRAELDTITPQRANLQARVARAQAELEDARLRERQIESSRKDLELEVEAKKELISKYSAQQNLTRKNEEYRALTHEIEMCQDAIRKTEDAQLDLMEKAEAVQKEVAAATRHAAEAKTQVDEAVRNLDSLEGNLKKQLDELLSNRDELAGDIDPAAYYLYDRLLKRRGDSVVVGIEHAVCGGCHMRLPAQVLVSCQSQSEVNTCPHCGRIIYYDRGMELVVVD
jgi:predicted  nucleic acid-binding Zn-ribbon protein